MASIDDKTVSPILDSDDLVLHIIVPSREAPSHLPSPVSESHEKRAVLNDTLSLYAAINAQGVELSALREEMAPLRKMRGQLDTIFAQLEKNRKEDQMENESLKEMVESLKAERLKELQVMRIAIRDLGQKLSEEIQMNLERSENMKRDRQEAKEELAELKSELQNGKERREALEHEFQEQRREREELGRIIRTDDERLTALERDNKYLLAEQTSVKQRVEDLREGHEALSSFVIQGVRLLFTGFRTCNGLTQVWELGHLAYGPHQAT